MNDMLNKALRGALIIIGAAIIALSLYGETEVIDVLFGIVAILFGLNSSGSLITISWNKSKQ